MLEQQLIEAETKGTDAESRADQLQAAYDAAAKEVGEVKQRARALLEEKDAQLQSARVSVPNFFGLLEMGCRASVHAKFRTDIHF